MSVVFCYSCGTDRERHDYGFLPESSQLIWAVTWVISLIWVISATLVVSLTWVVSVTFALPVIGRIAIGRGAIPGTVTSGPLVVGITERVGSIDLGDG